MRLSALALLSAAAFGQSSTGQSFDIADIHASPKTPNPYTSGGVLRGGRYEIRRATMVDLIRVAYGVDDDKVLGGPNWLDFDRFDVIAKAPQSTPPETLNLMLRALLAERFKLVVHLDRKTMPAYVLSVGEGAPKLKPADKSGEPGCRRIPQTPQPRETPDDAFSCHNLTMEDFAAWLRGMALVSLPAVDQTGLEGSWDFDLKWTPRGPLTAAGRGITIFDAVDKQLGLKLELDRAPLPVVVVDSVNRTPTENPPGVSSSLPPAVELTIRPSAPGEAPQPGKIGNGRVELQGWSLVGLIDVAWNISNNDRLAGAPKFLNSARFDVVAKVSTEQVDDEDLRPMLRALLVDRFKMKVHMEDRPVNVYTLTAVKPKLQKADGSKVAGCVDSLVGLDGKDPRLKNPMLNRLVTCRNTTMAKLAEQLQNFGRGYIGESPVVEDTGIEGAFDFTLSFTGAGMFDNGGGLAAADPPGALTLFDAVNQQLGLKLELQKRPAPVLVIDHIEEKPTDN